MVSFRYSRGFTLIEILMVLVVISVMVGLATVSLSPNPYTALNREASRLQAVLQMAADEAVMQGQQWSLALPDQGYQFLIFDNEESTWVGVDTEPFTLYELNSEITLKLAVEGSQIDPQTLEQMRKMQALDTDQSIQPVLLLLSSGEMTPFSITFSYEQYDAQVTLVTDGVSPIELMEEGDH